MTVRPSPARLPSWLLLVLLGLAVLAAGCTPLRGGGGDDDDDDDDDDDASADDDDDDDATTPGDDDDDDDVTPPEGCDNDEWECDDGECIDEDEVCDDFEDCDDGEDEEVCGDDDDDSFAPDGLSFSLLLSATPGSTATGISGTYLIAYWEDIDNQILLCNQRMEVEGSADFGFGILSSCANCTGHMVFEPTLVQDVSNPALDPEDCDPADLQASGLDYGTALLTPTNAGSPGEYGDFLSMALVDVDSMDALGLAMDANGQYDAAYLTTEFDTYGLEFTHAGYVNNVVGTMSELSGLDAVADNAGGSSSWYGFWQVWKDPAGNGWTGTDMSGDYGAQALWIINFTN